MSRSLDGCIGSVMSGVTGFSHCRRIGSSLTREDGGSDLNRIDAVAPCPLARARPRGRDCLPGAVAAGLDPVFRQLEGPAPSVQAPLPRWPGTLGGEVDCRFQAHH